MTATLETSVASRAIEAGARGALSELASMPETVDAIKRLTATQEASEHLGPEAWFHSDGVFGEEDATAGSFASGVVRR